MFNFFIFNKEGAEGGFFNSEVNDQFFCFLHIQKQKMLLTPLNKPINRLSVYILILRA